MSAKNVKKRKEKEFTMNNKSKKNDKWVFGDYAFAITGILVFVLLVVPEIMYAQFDIHFLGGSMSGQLPELLSELEHGQSFSVERVRQLRSLSPLLFLLTTTIVTFKDAFDAKKTGGYQGTIFTHSHASLFEDAIHMATVTIMVYAAVLANAMYISWLSGPITFVLFIIIFPFVRNKNSATDEVGIPWILLLLLVLGAIAGVIFRTWHAPAFAWLLICAVKCTKTIRKSNLSIDHIFDILYYAFSVILIGIGILFNFWITSWLALPLAIIICWILSKCGKYDAVNEKAAKVSTNKEV